MKAKIEEDKDNQVQKIEEEWARLNKKDQPEVNRDTLKEFVPHEILYKILKIMLKENIHINRGYVMDGYPKNFKMAEGLFTGVDETKEETDPTRFFFENAIVPNSVIRLECLNDSILKNRFKKKQEKDLVNTHYNELDMTRRIQEYRKDNESKLGEPSLSDFFIKNKLEVLGLDAEKREDVILDRIKVFVERVFI